MKAQQLLSLTRQAVQEYNMIQKNDCIAVGISGGKDSLTLLYALAKLKDFYPLPFSVKAITIDVGFENMNFEPVVQFCKDLGVEYVIEKTQIADIVFKERKEKNPCSLCSKMRKGSLNEVIKSMGCNKVAYAHHKDDVIETMMLSLLYEGRLHTFSPVTHLDKANIDIIRPLIFVNEAEVKGFVNKYNLPVVHSTCPADGNTKREYVHQIIKNLNADNPGVKNRMFTAVYESTLSGWNKDNLDCKY